MVIITKGEKNMNQYKISYKFRGYAKIHEGLSLGDTEEEAVKSFKCAYKSPIIIVKVENEGNFDEIIKAAEERLAAFDI